MDDFQRQEQEIERLKKKVASLTKAYQRAVQELDQLKREKEEPRRKGRPPVDSARRARVLTRYRQGYSMRRIAEEENLALGTVQKMISEVSKKSRIVYVFADREVPATIIDACHFTEKVKIVNLTDDMVSRAFGVEEKPDWNDYEEFLESRCMPRTRYGIREELRSIGINSYDPFQIVQVTRGRVYDDHQYLTQMKEPWIAEFDEIMKRRKNSVEGREELCAFLDRTEKEWRMNEGGY